MIEIIIEPKPFTHPKAEIKYLSKRWIENILKPLPHGINNKFG